MKRPLSEFSAEPIFTIKAVEQQTGIAATTLLAWEKRYGLVIPKRTRSDRRLYSAQDVALLQWVRQQMLSGLIISQVVTTLAEKRQNGETIWVESPPGTSPVKKASSMPPAYLVMPLYSALAGLDAAQADQLLAQALGSSSVSEVCIDLILPTWHTLEANVQRGTLLNLPVHFAAAYFRGQLSNLLGSPAENPAAPHLVIGCAPGDTDEIDSLALAVLAGQRGFHTTYLGPNIPLDDIRDALAHGSRPNMVILIASQRDSALRLEGAQDCVNRASQGKSRLGFGGRAFGSDPALCSQIAGIYLGATPETGLSTLVEIFRQEI